MVGVDLQTDKGRLETYRSWLQAAQKVIAEQEQQIKAYTDMIADIDKNKLIQVKSLDQDLY